MSIPGSSSALFLAAAAAGAGGYQVERSLRFNSSDSAYLSRTPASAGNRKTWSFSCWVKRGTIGGSYQNILSAANSVSDRYEVYFDTSTNQLTGEIRIGGTGYIITTTQVFRDPSAWYHILVVMDTSQATASNRHKFYVNGTQVTNFASASYPNQDATPQWNAADPHSIGRYQNGASQYLDGYLADIYFIDGQALDPSSFTETDATTGQLIPKAYTGSYGTNGFHLEFADNSAATATTLGKDTSGNSNNWTPNNLSVTAGAGNDSLVDTPTSYGTDTGAGGEVRGNYATLNPLDKATSGGALSNGNLDYAATVASWDMVRATFGISSGKWYWEVSVNSTTYGITGIAQASVSLNNNFFNSGVCYGYNANNGYKYQGSPYAALAYGATWNGSGDICGVAFNSDAGTLTFYKNGVSQGVAYTGLTGTFFPAHTSYPTGSATLNFGQRPFAYTAPSGFKALCDTNFGAPVVAKPNTVFNVITYTGTGANATIPNVNTVPTSIAFTPDLVWIKGRSGATDHALYDSVRDVQKDLVSNSTAAETTQSTGLTAFGTNTFDIGTLAKLNTSSSTYVGWCWDAGSAANPTTNTQGSITSSVRANASAGFSIVTYTGNGSSTGATVGHGLGVEPSFFIIKNRSASSDWVGYHKSVGSGFFLILNSTSAAVSSAMWDGAPSSTVLKLNDNSGGTFTETNTNGQNYVAYCFAPVTGYSAMGSFSGGSGIFTYTGFRPKWLLIKQSSAVSSWIIYDTSRDTYNVMGNSLYPNLSDAEISSPPRIDFVSNGFVTRASSGSEPSWTGTVIYYAVAESPFNYARAR